MRIAIYLSILMLAIGCQSPKKNSDKPIVSVSIAPQKYFIERLAGDAIEVNVMIPKGAEHATYAPSASQIKKLDQSIAYFKMGHLGFEAAWNEKLKAANPTMKWYDLSEGIQVIQGGHHHHDHGHDHGHSCTCSAGADPHTWTSPVEVKHIMKNLKDHLSELFPATKDVIAANYESFISELDAMDERLSTIQQKNDKLTFMIFHPAYTYLARAYGFNQLTIEFEGKTPTPARLKSTIEEARANKIKTIYIQQEFDQSNAEIIAKEIGAKTVQVNPLSENWKQQMENFISQLEKQ